ncbi:uncharacterized protein TrAFT101_007480 [Trichoderma asperellum]|uniref:DUF8035 domain-containing protein n=1 Tax=Trichoderma asperellum (strain ATCC 204424 / CBS 433.97 / NBRC 101777) TaxID=1042311 RepID=A0A2T3Z4M1_TRIA4|nr:hypothetical protein M441DRAFT_70846 [Trichoderma asperellum CBS 433.97]PTB39744.1 hypothetical protein M441DRAFT_70846 [Trichoderma asperellum CBS 433.97]UKZ92531.1 hypothetical protein TrAFT101_007480 [Trichoderma asperellum]
MSSLYDSEDDISVRVARHDRSPPAVRYVHSPPVRGAQYEYGSTPTYLGPEHRTTVVAARSHSRTRSPPRDFRESPRNSRVVVGAPVPPPPPAPAPAPIIINNRIYNEHDSDEDGDDIYRRSRRPAAVPVVYRRSSRSRSRSRSRSSSRSSHGPRTGRMTRDEWEAEQARRDLELMRLNQDREKEDRRREKEYREEAELRLTQRQLEVIKKREAEEEAEKRIKMEIEFKQKELEFKRHKDREAEEEQQKRLKMEFEFKQKELEFKRHKEAEAAAEEKRKRDKEYRDEAELRHAQLTLEGIKKRDAEAELEKRIKKELELKRLKEEEEAAEEKRRRDALAHDAVEKYKKAEADRIAHEQKMREQNDKEYKRRLHDDLVKSGLDEHAIEAILSQKKVQKAPAPAPAPALPPAHPPAHLPMVPALPAPELHMERHTYTRMARRYLSIETLRTFNIDFEFDADPEYVLVKRWVPEWEQDQFWEHTKQVRERRTKTTLMVEDRHSSHSHHRSRSTELEIVRKKSKHDRKRSKSPGPLLMYLAGARPS